MAMDSETVTALFEAIKRHNRESLQEMIKAEMPMQVVSRVAERMALVEASFNDVGEPIEPGRIHSVEQIGAMAEPMLRMSGPSLIDLMEALCMSRDESSKRHQELIRALESLSRMLDNGFENLSH